MYGLGGVTYNIARTAPSWRDVSRYFNAPIASAPPRTMPTAPAAPRVPTAVPLPPVLKAPTPKPITARPMTPAVSTVGTKTTPVLLTSGAPMSLTSDSGDATTAILSPEKSPVWLIAAGLAALLLLNRKKGR